MSASDVLKKLVGNACLMTGVAACAPSIAQNLSEPKGQGFHTATAQVAFVDEMERRTFRYFGHYADSNAGILPGTGDNTGDTCNAGQLSLIGNSLMASALGASRGWVARDEAAARTLQLLSLLSHQPRSPNGAYPQFNGLRDAGSRESFFKPLNTDAGMPVQQAAVSSQGNALLTAGIRFVESYYDQDTVQEKRIRDVAHQLDSQADWSWLEGEDSDLISHSPSLEDRLSDRRDRTDDTAAMVDVAAPGSGMYPLGPDIWSVRVKNSRQNFGGYQAYRYIASRWLNEHATTQRMVDFASVRVDSEYPHQIASSQHIANACKAQRCDSRETGQNPRRVGDREDLPNLPNLPLLANGVGAGEFKWNVMQFDGYRREAPA
jgi:hypothetical protein